jgi:hypothetical protein
MAKIKAASCTRDPGSVFQMLDDMPQNRCMYRDSGCGASPTNRMRSSLRTGCERDFYVHHTAYKAENFTWTGTKNYAPMAKKTTKTPAKKATKKPVTMAEIREASKV